MNHLVWILVWVLPLTAQWEEDSLFIELEEQNELAYETALLERLFDAWEKTGNQFPQGTFRQSLSYQPAARDWRFLNKSRIQTPRLEFTCVLEQDPYERDLADHLVLALATRKIPGLDYLILGNFQLNWGSGYLPGQPVRRASLATPSPHLRFALRPHYSTREQNFYSGIGLQSSWRRLHLAAFLSRRRQVGIWQGTEFREDSDGVHESWNQYSFRWVDSRGLALRYEREQLQLLLASIQDEVGAQTDWEWGFRWAVRKSSQLQCAGDGRGNRSVSGYTHQKRLTVTLQFQDFGHKPDLQSNSLLTFLPGDMAREQSITARVQLKLTERWRMRAGFDQAWSPRLKQIRESGRVTRQDLQVLGSLNQVSLQLDLSVRSNDLSTPVNTWEPHPVQPRLVRTGISWTREMSSAVQYRGSLKFADQTNNRSWLLHQRLAWERDPWILHVGFTRHAVPNAALRLGGYESGPAESFGFFTAYDDGQRWFCHLRYTIPPLVTELKISAKRGFDPAASPEQVTGIGQLSIVF